MYHLASKCYQNSLLPCMVVQPLRRPNFKDGTYHEVSRFAPGRGAGCWRFLDLKTASSIGRGSSPCQAAWERSCDLPIDLPVDLPMDLPMDLPF